MALNSRQLGVRLLAVGGGGLLLGAIACTIGFTSFWTGPTTLGNALFPAGIFMLGISALLVLAGLVMLLVSLVRKS